MMLRCSTRLIGSTTHAHRSATFIFSKTVAPRQLSNIIPAPATVPSISAVLKTSFPSLELTPYTHILRIRVPVFLACSCSSMPALPPHVGALARRALLTAGPALAQPHMHSLSRRALGVNHTQGVTLGVIAAYIVIIAILWNVPYIRWVLWPFKVNPPVFSILKPGAHV
jgi:hypothetical protein